MYWFYNSWSTLLFYLEGDRPVWNKYKRIHSAPQFSAYNTKVPVPTAGNVANMATEIALKPALAPEAPESPGDY